MVQNIKNMIKTKIETIRENINVLQHYCNLKNTLQDWHAVSDAANDIRELNSEWKALTSVLDYIEEKESEPVKEKENENINDFCDQCRGVVGIFNCPCRRM